MEHTKERNRIFKHCAILFIPFPLLMLGINFRLAALAGVLTLIVPTIFLGIFMTSYWEEELINRYYDGKLDAFKAMSPNQRFSKVNPYRVALIVFILANKNGLFFLTLSHCRAFFVFEEEVPKYVYVCFYLSIAAHLAATYALSLCHVLTSEKSKLTKVLNNKDGEGQRTERRAAAPDPAVQTYFISNRWDTFFRNIEDLTETDIYEEQYTLFNALGKITLDDITDSPEAAREAAKIISGILNRAYSAKVVHEAARQIVEEERSVAAAKRNPQYRHWAELCSAAKLSSGTEMPGDVFSVFRQMNCVSLIDIVESKELSEKFRAALKENGLNAVKVKNLMDNLRKYAESSMWEDLKNKSDFNHRPVAVERGDEGEKNAQYILKWWANTHESVLIEKDCESQYSSKCIRLANWDFIREPQEFDHIVVTPAGVIHIETKTYGGTIDIKDTETWIRDGRTIQSPAAQVRRHEMLLKSIVGSDVPVIGLICIADPATDIIGESNSEIPVISIRYMERRMDKLMATADTHLDAAKMGAILQRINSAKISNPQ